jgi:hypothetical protein
MEKGEIGFDLNVCGVTVGKLTGNLDCSVGSN